MNNSEEICSACGLPMHPDDPKRYCGWYTTHQHSRCIDLLRTELAAAQRQIASMGHVATGATEAYYDADETIADLRQKLAAAQERIRAMEGDAARFIHLQNIDPKDAQAFFWNFNSRRQRAAAIDASIAKEADRG